ncbi:MAG: DUF11 domain-containing protein, partial [Streptosporangiaceae bacterium]
MTFQLRPSARALAVVTAVAVAGLAPSLTESAHADGPIRAHAQRKAPPKKKHHRPVKKPAVAKVVFNGGGPRVPLRPGTVYTWPYAVTNQGPARASGVTLQAALSDNLEFVSAQGNCSFRGSGPACVIGALAPGQTVTGMISAKVSFTAPSGQPVINGVQIVWGGHQSPGSFPATTVAASADLVVTKSGSATVKPGQTVAYDVTVRNQGPAAASQVVLHDNVSPIRAGQAVPLTLVHGPAQCAASETAAGPALTCSLGDLAVGAEKTVRMQVRVGARTRPGTLLNAPAKAVTPTFDTNLANNQAVVRTKVVSPIRLAA